MIKNKQNRLRFFDLMMSAGTMMALLISKENLFSKIGVIFSIIGLAGIVYCYLSKGDEKIVL
jgi:hypothetical protein